MKQCLFVVFVLLWEVTSALRGASNDLEMLRTTEFPVSDSRSVGLTVDHGDVWMYYHSFDSQPGVVQHYDAKGELVSSFTPPGDKDSITASFQSADLEMVYDSINLGGEELYGKTLLFINGNYNKEPKMLDVYALDVSTGMTKSFIRVNLGDWVAGGTYHRFRKSLFVVTVETDELIELNPVTGNVMARIKLSDFGYTQGAGDVAYDETTGHLFLVSSLQNTLLELTPDGQFVREMEIPYQGYHSGLDVECGKVWISDSFHPNRVRQLGIKGVEALC